MPSLKEQSLSYFFSQVTDEVCKRLNIEGLEFMAPFERREKINQNHPCIAKKLQNFIGTYNEWYKYNYSENGEKNDESCGEEKAERLLRERDIARHELRTALKV